MGKSTIIPGINVNITCRGVFLPLLRSEPLFENHASELATPTTVINTFLKLIEIMDDKIPEHMKNLIAHQMISSIKQSSKIKRDAYGRPISN